jgi:hypothetical protein
MNTDKSIETINSRKEKRRIYNQKYYENRKKKVDLEKKGVCEEKQKQESYMEKLYNKMIELETQIAGFEVMLYSQSKSTTSKQIIQPEPQEKKKIVVKSQTQEPETIEKLPAEHKKLYDAFKKQQAKTQQAPSTTTTDYESESESEESEFEIDADGNII